MRYKGVSCIKRKALKRQAVIKDAELLRFHMKPWYSRLRACASFFSFCSTFLFLSPRSEKKVVEIGDKV